VHEREYAQVVAALKKLGCQQAHEDDWHVYLVRGATIVQAIPKTMVPIAVQRRILQAFSFTGRISERHSPQLSFVSRPHLSDIICHAFATKRRKETERAGTGWNQTPRPSLRFSSRNKRKAAPHHVISKSPKTGSIPLCSR
jgi:hypothetical protein